MNKVFVNAVTGERTVVPFTPEEKTAHLAKATQSALRRLRERRDSLLEESDAYVLPDRWASYSPEKQAQWSTYRQALRDLPENTRDPFNPVWPTKPEK